MNLFAKFPFSTIRIGSAPTYFITFTGEIKVRSNLPVMYHFQYQVIIMLNAQCCCPELFYRKCTFIKREFSSNFFTNSPLWNPITVNTLKIFFSKSPILGTDKGIKFFIHRIPILKYLSLFNLSQS